eukprot:TRINITY_DN983_c0_g1_i2.p2 TRINITY_DN983_c0_g1~~TRINITY_DN983_c0_g1_i2.p2  ORF type:complete len:52 (-),score=3.10 TRINITY_DN983_c0_g1_i2:160-315(-)
MRPLLTHTPPPPAQFFCRIFLCSTLGACIIQFLGQNNENSWTTNFLKFFIV